MIRQAISCDICGAEKKQTNHWFVAWEQAGELRVSGWSSRNRTRSEARHLCGQVCLHKLADEFMARVIAQKSAGKAEPAAAEEMQEETWKARTPAAELVRDPGVESPLHAGLRLAGRMNDRSLTSPVRETALVSAAAAALVVSTPPPAPRPASNPIRALDAPPAEIESKTSSGSPAGMPGASRFATRNRCDGAWERERERAQRAAEHGPQIVTRKIAGA